MFSGFKVIEYKVKPRNKVYLLVYSGEKDLIIEPLNKEEIDMRVKQLNLAEDEYAVIDGKILKRTAKWFPKIHSEIVWDTRTGV